MIKSYLKPISIAMVTSLFIAGCGNSNTSNGTIGYNDLGFNGKFVDAPVDGIGWSCGNAHGLTKNGGLFGICPNGSTVTFKIGNIILGNVKQTNDFIFTPQDLAAVGRSEVTNKNVVKITSLILSLADNKDSKVLVIKTATATNFEKQVTAKDINAITSDDINNGVTNIGKVYVDETVAETHLNEQAQEIKTITVAQPTDKSTN